MAVDILNTWVTTMASLPKVANNSWATNFSNWYKGRIAIIETDPAIVAAVNFQFPFDDATFISALQALGPEPLSTTGIQGFANAWESAINGTTPTTDPGTAGAGGTPEETFSSVDSVTIDAASVAAGKAKIMELVSAPKVDDALNSEFPIKFREATLLLTVTIVGLDSQSPPDGPASLTIEEVPLF